MLRGNMHGDETESHVAAPHVEGLHAATFTGTAHFSNQPKEFPHVHS